MTRLRAGNDNTKTACRVVASIGTDGIWPFLEPWLQYAELAVVIES